MSAARTRTVALRYVLRDGTRGTLHCLAASTADAVLLALATWGAALRTCSARALQAAPMGAGQ